MTTSPTGATSLLSPALRYTTDNFDERSTIIQFRDNELLFTDMGGRPPDDNQKAIIALARKTNYSGKMTNQAQKRMVRAITLLSQSHTGKWITNPVNGRMQFFKLSLITLTVSSHTNTCARTAYRKLLSPFLNWIRYTLGVRHYVWKAELQGRGQIHYHIILPKFIHYKVLRDKWNKMQSDNGYLRDYVEEHKHWDANSTDIHGIGNEVKKVAKYCIKYLGKSADTASLKARNEAEKQYRNKKITKKELAEILSELELNEQRINGKLWDCSESLNEKYFTIHMTWRLGMFLSDYFRDNPYDCYYGERFCSLAIDFTRPPPFMEKVMKRYACYLEYIKAGGEAILN